MLSGRDGISRMAMFRISLMTALHDPLLRKEKKEKKKYKPNLIIFLITLTPNLTR